MSINVGIYLFPEVEALDFVGPFEVFTTSSRVALRNDPSLGAPFNVFSIAESHAQVPARAGLRVVPDYSFDDHPQIDLLVVPGGVIHAELTKQRAMQWIYQCAQHAGVVASVCTGAFMLAKAGVITGGQVTTHWEDQQELADMFPSLDVIHGPRWVEQGKHFTSAGIAAGIDLSLHLVGKLCTPDLAAATARQMDYPWVEGSGRG
jgi:transcriptional regulator GlxA family with amidase domain